MLLNRLFVFFVIVLVILVALYLASEIFGPGIKDGSSPIIDGYDLFDAGGYERLIVYREKNSKGKVIVDARVDDYKVESGNLYVARRPRLIEQDERNGTLNSKLSEKCEYLIVNLDTNQVFESKKSNGLYCK